MPHWSFIPYLTLQLLQLTYLLSIGEKHFGSSHLSVICDRNIKGKKWKTSYFGCYKDFKIQNEKFYSPKFSSNFFFPILVGKIENIYKGPSINDITKLGGGSSKSSISLYSKMGDKGQGEVKNLKKWVTSFMDDPLMVLILG